MSFNSQIKGLQEYISRLEGADKTSKKATDAIKKLREELARLTALDNLLGDAPSQLEVLERRSDTLLKGLKTLVDAGVSPNSRAFRSFALEAANLGQQIDQLKAIGGTLDLKPVAVKSLIPQTIGDTLPQDVARLLGDYAKQTKLFELPVAVKLNMQAISEAMQPVQLLNKEVLRLAGLEVKPNWDGFVPKMLNTELLKIGTSYQQIRAASDLFGDSLQGFDEAGARANQLRESMMNLVQAGFAPTSQYLQDFKQQYQEASAASLQFARDVQASSIVQQGAVDVVSGLGQALGNALSGTAGFSDSLVKTVLSGVGEVAVQLGKILVASGLGIEALKVSLKTFSGVGAVVAGLGLIAIGTFASSAAASIGNNAGRSAPVISSSAASSPRNFTPTTAPAAAQASAVYTHKVEIVASGANLAGVLTLNTDRLGRVVGRR